jgi:SET domain-containing protein 6
MHDAGISWDETVVQLSEGLPGCAPPGWGVHAVADVQPGHVLAVIPKSAILSCVNTSIADILVKERIGAGLGLVVAALYERCIGADSRWCALGALFGIPLASTLHKVPIHHACTHGCRHTYLRSLPAREYLPVFWSPSEVRLLRGTELEDRAQADAHAMATDWEEEVEGLQRKYPRRIPAAGWTLDNFRAAASWVASRSFRVDAEHGDALVSGQMEGCVCVCG